MKTKFFNLKSFLIALAISPVVAFGAGVSVDGNIYTSGGYIHAAVGQIVAGNYMAAGNYMQAPFGFFTNSLRVAGGVTYANYSVGLTGASASGQYAVAAGPGTSNSSYGSFVVGKYNLNTAKDGTTAPNPTASNDNDPLFAVGNGTGNDADPVAIKNRNAFTVYKDGTITMSKAQGDISMGQFGN